MIDRWSLPKTAVIGGEEYQINTDFRDMLEIIDTLTSGNSPIQIRWEIAVRLFYDRPIPLEYHIDAIKVMIDFMNYGEKQGSKKDGKLIDWTLDATTIIGDVNKVAGFDVRSVPYIHWWTFLSFFNGIGEGQLSTLVSIRWKLLKRKKLENWEQEFYMEHKAQVDFRSDDEVKKVQDYFNKWI